MSEFEHSLREALASREPPKGFTERVMDRERAVKPMKQMKPTKRTRQARASWAGNWAAAAAVVAVLVGGAWIDTNQVRRVRGERAKEDVLLALRITGATLRSVRAQVQQIRTRPN
jgi:hypothetical protein